MSSAAPLPSSLRSIAVIAPTWLGDTIMATPVYRALHRAFPAARRGLFVHPGQSALFAGSPWFDHIETIQPRGLAGPLRTAGALRRWAPDAILLLPNSARAAVIGRLAGVPRRIGFARDGRRALLTHPIAPRDVTRPHVTRDDYCHLIEAALGTDAEPIDPTVELHVNTDEQARAAALTGGAPYVVLVPGGSKPAKQWRPERFTAVGRMLAKEFGHRILVSGSPGEQELVAGIARAIGSDALDLASAGIDLGALKAIIGGAQLLVTNDTGPRHIAVALDTPIVALYGPTDSRWTCLAQAREFALRAEPFLPANLVADDLPEACAIDRISVGDVCFACRKMLESSA